MKIGELAERTGLAPSKIRFYEARGLIAPVQRQANGYREYLPQSVQLLEIIVTAQAGGFSLDEIRHLLPTAGMEKWNREKLIASRNVARGKRHAGVVDVGRGWTERFLIKVKPAVHAE